MSVTAGDLAPFLATTRLLHSIDVDRDGVVRDANPAALERLKADRDLLVGSTLVEHVVERDGRAALALLDGSSRSATVEFVAADMISFPLFVNALAHDHGVLLLGEPPILPYLRLGDDLAAHANDLAVRAREHGRRARQLAQEMAVDKRSHWQLRRDQEVLPICMGCRRVNTSDGGWEELDKFLARSSDFLSHGYCDVCAESVTLL